MSDPIPILPTSAEARFSAAFTRFLEAQADESKVNVTEAMFMARTFLNQGAMMVGQIQATLGSSLTDAYRVLLALVPELHGHVESGFMKTEAEHEAED